MTGLSLALANGLHRRLPEIAGNDDVVIIDTPQIEDHAAIARSALRYADEIIIPCAPSPAGAGPLGDRTTGR
jgi:cellulose biosynthesis protein BcsQ